MGQGRAGQGSQGRYPPAVFNYRQGKGKGRADTRPLFSVMLTFIDRPSDDKV